MRGSVTTKTLSPLTSGQLKVLSSSISAAGLIVGSVFAEKLVTRPPGRILSMCAPQFNRARFFAWFAAAVSGIGSLAKQAGTVDEKIQVAVARVARRKRRFMEPPSYVARTGPVRPLRRPC